jgi:hypothetical protein
MRPDPEDLYETLIAACNRKQAQQLVDYDHHRVTINGRAAVLLTYHWMPLEDAVEPLLIKAIFHYAEQHPPAPPQIQAIIETLQFYSA